MLNLNINTLSSLRTGSIAPPPSLATVTTATVTNITATGATGGGTISGGTGSVVTESGVCWSLTANPTTSNDKAISGATSGSFTVNLSGLTGSTGYYARAYAINGAGTAYGNEVTFTTASSTLTIGQAYQGGKIAYLDGTGQHGFVVSNGDIGTAQWGCQGTSVSTSTSFGSGASNTANILAACDTAGIAARICDSYTNDGYSGWYLPSKDEMQTIINNGQITGDGAWWTSSQGTNYQYAWQMYNSVAFSEVTKSTSNKSVRAIRNF